MKSLIKLLFDIRDLTVTTCITSSIFLLPSAIWHEQLTTKVFGTVMAGSLVLSFILNKICKSLKMKIRLRKRKLMLMNNITKEVHNIDKLQKVI